MYMEYKVIITFHIKCNDMLIAEVLILCFYQKLPSTHICCFVVDNDNYFNFTVRWYRLVQTFNDISLTKARKLNVKFVCALLSFSFFVIDVLSITS